MVTLGGLAEALCNSQNDVDINNPNSTDLGVALQRTDTANVRITFCPLLGNCRAQTLGEQDQIASSPFTGRSTLPGTPAGLGMC